MAHVRRKQVLTDERWSHTFDHAALTATLAAKRYKVPAGKTLRIERILYVNPTGLAADNTNTFRLEIFNGANLVSLVFNTDGNDVPAGAALAANTYIDQAPTGVAANQVFAGGDTVTATFTLEGTQTLPAGTLILEGRLV